MQAALLKNPFIYVLKSAILLMLPFWSFSQTAANQKISLLDSKVELNVSSDLTEMTAEIWKLKYGTTARPVLALSDKNAQVNLLAQYTTQEWDENNLEEYKTFRIDNLKKTRKDIKILGEGIKDVSGKRIGYIKFISDAIDSKIFNYYFFAVVDGKILLFTFNCMEKLRPDWEKVADEIVGSMKIK